MVNTFGNIESTESEVNPVYEFDSVAGAVESGYFVELNSSGKIIKATGSKNVEGVVIGISGEKTSCGNVQTVAVHGRMIMCVYAGTVDYTMGADAFVDANGKCATSGTIKVGRFIRQRSGSVAYIERL
jgi:hypothetical protein